MNGNDKGLDSPLWHACAGGMVQMPLVNSKVFYFPQGHVEHMQNPINVSNYLIRIPPLILCRVNSVRYMADLETDEVYAKIILNPLKDDDQDCCEENDALELGRKGSDLQEKHLSFAKTLTQSDANNGGGFSVPRFCAETIFPRLDYSADLPLQEIFPRDVHGKVWKFRHIYRGTPRRHLLTTGWSSFVSEKKLVAGDSVVFLRRESGEICMGIRRGKRGLLNGIDSQAGWNHSTANRLYRGISIFSNEEESKLRGKSYGGSNTRLRGKVNEDSAIRAMILASNGQPFKVVYYPRAGTPEFCVKASTVRAAMRVQWCSGLRFKMPFETEDSSRISWFTGTICAVQCDDSMRWPGSPWRLLQVLWDEPNLLQNVRSVSPWLVELVANMPAAVHFPPFSSLRKKPRIRQPPDFHPIIQNPATTFSENLHIPSSSPMCFLPDSTPAAGIQGARQTPNALFSTGFHKPDQFASPFLISSGPILPNPTLLKDESCLLTLGKKECSQEKKPFMLFGKVILTEEELSVSKNSSSDMISDRSNVSDVSGTTIHPTFMGDCSPSEVHYLN